MKNVEKVLKILDYAKDLFFYLYNDQNLSYNDALQKVAEDRKNDPDFEATLFQNDNDTIINVLSSHFANRQFVLLQEVLNRYQNNEGSILISLSQDKQFKALRNEIFGEDSKIKGEAVATIIGGLRNAFAHGNFEDQSFDDKITLNYYSKTLKSSLQTSITPMQISQLLNIIISHTIRHDCRPEYIWNTEKSRDFLKTKTLDTYVRKLAIRRLQINGKTYKKIYLDNVQRQCLKTLFKNNNTSGISDHFVTEKLLFNNVEKANQLSNLINLLNCIKHADYGKSAPFQDILYTITTFFSEELNMPIEELKYDLSDRMTMLNIMICELVYILGLLEKDVGLTTTAHFKYLPQHIKGMSGVERLRDSLVHGRYIFDGGDRVYFYDGRDNYHLEYMFSLNIHELIATKDELTQHYLAAIQEKQNNDEDFEEKEQR